jgi:hypothetical protein
MPSKGARVAIIELTVSIFKSLLLTELRLPKAIVHYDFSNRCSLFPEFRAKGQSFPYTVQRFIVTPSSQFEALHPKKGLRFQ